MLGNHAHDGGDDGGDHDIFVGGEEDGGVGDLMGSPAYVLRLSWIAHCTACSAHQSALQCPWFCVRV